MKPRVVTSLVLSLPIAALALVDVLLPPSGPAPALDQPQPPTQDCPVGRSAGP